MPEYVYLESDRGKLECTWNEDISKWKKNHNGTTAWVNVHRRSCGVKHDDPELIRVHICKNNPCTAQWLPSKYGPMPTPIHVRQLTWTKELEADLNGDSHGAGGYPSVPSAAPPPLPPPPDAPTAHAVLADDDPDWVKWFGVEGHGAEHHCAEDEQPHDQNEEETHKHEDDEAEEVPAAVAAVPEALPQCEPTSASPW